MHNHSCTLFAGYPTAVLEGKRRITFNPGAAGARYKSIRQNLIVSFLPNPFLPAGEVDALLSKLGEARESDVNDLLQHVSAGRCGVAHRTLAGFTKLNLTLVVSARKCAVD